MKREKVWRVGLYLRLSREDGREESLSIENQRKILLEYLERDFSDPFVLEGEYLDDGRTGTDDSRPGFQALIGDIRGGKVTCVVCKSLSRAFRNYADQGYFLEQVFPRCGTRFIALGSPTVDSYRDPEAVQLGLEIPISGILNDRYAAKTSADVRRTLDMKRRQGEFIGSFAPYGYRKDPEDRHHLLPDPEAARVVGDIFRWYAQGESKGTIASRLNQRGLPNPAAYKGERGWGSRRENDGLWTPATVSRILANPVYGGDLVQGRQRVVSYKVHRTVAVPEEDWFIVRGTHEAIVEETLFRRVRERTQTPTRITPGTGEVHLLAGLVRCRDCGKAMTRKTARGRAYYVCSTYRRKSKTLCTKHSTREDLLLDSLSHLLGGPLTRGLLLERVEGVFVGENGEIMTKLFGESEGKIGGNDTVLLPSEMIHLCQNPGKTKDTEEKML